MDAVQRFGAFFANFRTTPEWRAMLNTREDSPWHREENVAEHTRMLISWYASNLLNSRSEKQRMWTLVGCLFHDVGKPPSEIQKFSEERGHYRAYHGHEQVSARMWVSYAAKHHEFLRDLLHFGNDDISFVALMLEHHVPFSLKHKDKRVRLKTAMMARFGDEGHRAWLDLLLSDQHGRISDGQAEKLAAVDEWMKEWETVNVLHV